MMLHDASWYIMMDHDASWWIMMHHDASWCIMMDHDGSWCIMMDHDASWWIMMHHDESWWIVMHHDGSWCIMMHHGASWCIMIQICIIIPSSFCSPNRSRTEISYWKFDRPTRNRVARLFVTPKIIKNIKILGLGLLELLPDIRDMQSGAKCRSESNSGIHFAPKCVKKAPGPGMEFLARSKAQQRAIWLYIDI